MAGSLTVVEARIHPGNRAVDTRSDEYMDLYNREVAQLEVEITPLLQSEMDEERMRLLAERWGSTELALKMTANGLAKQVVGRELTKRGIGWPLDTIVVQEGDGITQYNFVDDPEVPFGEAIFNELKIIKEEKSWEK